jgi:uncharacterized protein HemX
MTKGTVTAFVLALLVLALLGSGVAGYMYFSNRVEIANAQTQSAEIKVQDLEKNQKVDRVKQLKKLVNKRKAKIEQKTKEKVNVIREKINRQKFGNYLLEKFETHILQMPK